MSLTPTRRGFLGALGMAASCPFIGSAQAQTGGGKAGGEGSDAVAHATDAPQLAPYDLGPVPYTGLHQAGITTQRPAYGLIASFDLVATTPDTLQDCLQRLTMRIAYLTQGGEVAQLDPALPPADSGILGGRLYPDALTITVSLGAGLFDRLDWLAAHKPPQLVQMPRFPNDALDAAWCHGDLSLQICADTAETTIHALRDLIKQLRDHMILRWKQEGSVPKARDHDAGSARNLLGFRDGSANPDANDAAVMERIVWTAAPTQDQIVKGQTSAAHSASDAARPNPPRPNPPWTQGGSYQVVRLIRNFAERWDRTPLREQERIIGRVRLTGAPLDQPAADEFAAPDFAADPVGALTPLDSHIRLANPRGPQDQRHLMLRRPFNYSNGATKSGQLDLGLLFICYQADLELGFVTVQRRLDGEPLEEYIKPFGGGYFFTLPGVLDAQDYLGSTLIAAVRQAATQSPFP